MAHRAARRNSGGRDPDTGGLISSVALDLRIGEPVPRAPQAVIDRRKLVDYALNPRHPTGRHKAAVFSAALDIRIEHADWLATELLSALPSCAVIHVRPAAGESPARAVVPIELHGRNGRRLTILTIWKTINGYPELVTLRVARREQGGHE